MIVIDSSAMVEALVGPAPADELLTALSGEVHAPHLLDNEVMSVLRGLELSGQLGPEKALSARLDFMLANIERHELAPHADEVWRLRHQFTAYDATYLALAGALAAPLHTCDTKLQSPSHGVEVVVHRRSTGD